jgi:hypothetical protein
MFVVVNCVITDLAILLEQNIFLLTFEKIHTPIILEKYLEKSLSADI